MTAPRVVHTICVYCGSSDGADPIYRAAAVQLADAMVDQGIGLVYGGASVGLMGAVADQVLARGGRAEGVLPAFMSSHVKHVSLTELHIVKSMHERKELMRELSDAFIALPGGLGTWEELLEVATLTQLCVHDKPCGVLNVRGYYNPMLKMIEQGVDQGFIREAHRDVIQVDEEGGQLIQKLKKYEQKKILKWAAKDA